MTSTDEQPTPAPHRRRGSALDLVRSLGLVTLIVVAMVMASRINQPSRPPVTMDVAATVAAARAQADFPVLAATALPAQWYANAAYFEPVAQEPGHWRYRIGYTDGGGGSVVIDASNANDPKDVLGEYPFSDPVGTRVIAGVTVQRYAKSENDVWMHRATAAEPYTMVIGGNGSSGVDAVVQALATSGAVATGATTS